MKYLGINLTSIHIIPCFKLQNPDERIKEDLNTWKDTPRS